MRTWADWFFGGSSAGSGSAANSSEQGRHATATIEPEDLMCSISACLFRDPVMLVSGHTFERASLEEFWLRRPLVNPLGTGERLKSAQMIINYGCRSQVDSFLERHPGYTPDGWEGRSTGHRSTEAVSCGFRCSKSHAPPLAPTSRPSSPVKRLLQGASPPGAVSALSRAHSQLAPLELTLVRSLVRS